VARTPRTQRRFERLIARDGNFCCWCSAEMIRTPDTYPPSRTPHRTVEHLLPRAAGGSNWLSNLTLACHRCNQRRKDTPAGVFAHLRMQNGGNVRLWLLVARHRQLLQRLRELGDERRAALISEQLRILRELALGATAVIDPSVSGAAAGKDRSVRVGCDLASQLGREGWRVRRHLPPPEIITARADLNRWCGECQRRSVTVCLHGSGRGRSRDEFAWLLYCGCDALRISSIRRTELTVR
jgi:hypothetical protein